VKINRSIILSRRQRTINIVLNVLIPVIWFYLISPIIFPKDKIITRDEREKMNTKESGSKLGDNSGYSPQDY